LHLPQQRPEMLPGAEVCGRVVDDEVQSFQRCTRGAGGPSQLAEVFVGAAVDGFGDQVLLAVEEFVDRRRRIAGQVGDAAQRAVPVPWVATRKKC
jgi:hypothetical protein